MSRPPAKRPRGPGPGPGLDLDPFDEDFTQDDLAEIDIIASQAITTATGGASTATPTAASGPGHHDFTGSRAALDTHTQLQRKVEEELLLKSGEIRVLRDSLRAAQHEAETQKLKLVQVQSLQQKQQSQREKELLKKVQSLESQLQFKDAELNDVRSKILTDRRRHSPHPQRSASPSGGFVTQESFAARVRAAPVPANHTPPKSRRQEVTRADPFLCVRAPGAPQPGGVLLGLLLQPESQSLCHLLSPTSSLLGGDVTGSGQTPVQKRVQTLVQTPVQTPVQNPVQTPVQSLALTGLNQMSLNRSCRSDAGALLLLPLLRSLLSSSSSSSLSPDSHGTLPSRTSSVPQCTGAGVQLEEQVRLNPEERVLVALRTLTTLLQHSPQVVEAVLLEESHKNTGAKVVDSISQSPLLPCVLRLCRSPHTEVTCAALTTLQVLVQRSPDQHQDRLRCVLSEVCACVSADQRLKVVSLCVSVLTTLSDLSVTPPLCSHHEPCVVLRILQFVRSRSDPEATHSDWVQLDLKVVRFLSRILTQSPNRSTDNNCPCYSQMVQCVVLVLHRLWLDLRSSQAPHTPAQATPAQAPPTPAQAPPTPAQAPPSAAFLSGRVLASLRETVLLFHWLLQNHSGFTESVRGVLHLYDQVIPALRDTLRPTCYSQELVLDEICRLEPDDDMETDAAS